MPVYPLTKENKHFRRLLGYGRAVRPNDPGSPPVEYKIGTTVTLPDQVTLGVSRQPWSFLLQRGQGSSSQLKGQKFNVAYKSMTYHYQSGSGGSLYVYSQVGFAGSGQILYSLTGLPVISPVVYSKAAEALIKSYINGVQEWDGGAFIAELGDLRNLTKGSLGSMCKVTLKGVTALKELWRRLKKADVDTIARELSALYLEWGFAIKPLANDVVGFSNAISSHVKSGEKESIRIRGSAIGSVQTIFNEVRDLTLTSAYQLVNQYKEESCKFHGKAYPSADPLGLRKFGLHGDNGLSAMWEGVPFSFLLDYVSNAQEVISQSRWWWTSLDWLEQGSMNKIMTHASNGILKPLAGNVKHTCSGGGWTSQSKLVERVPLVFFPVPEFRFEIPGGKQIANMSALATALGTAKAPPLF